MLGLAKGFMASVRVGFSKECPSADAGTPSQSVQLSFKQTQRCSSQNPFVSHASVVDGLMNH